MDWLRSAALTVPDAPALLAGERVVPYRELDRAADAVAGVIAAAGIGPGGAVALWGENTPGAVAALWGVPRSGATAVVLPVGTNPAEAMRLTRETGARGLWGGGSGPDIDRLLASPSSGRPATHDGPPAPEARYVVFTSGSTGAPRGVLLTGRQVEASAVGSAERLGTDAEDTWLCVLPLGHVGGLSIAWRQARAGGAVVLHDGFDADRVAGALAGAATIASLVPTMLHRVLATGASFAGLRAVLIGGGPAAPTLVVEARAAGIPALGTYGMTETASQVCTEDPDDLGPVGTAGRPLQGVAVRTVDEAGDPADEGRIQVRGDIVTPGYVGLAERDPDAWYTTADLGRLDGSGRLIVRGRADRMIVTGGENVHPAAVEAALMALPGVAAARVRGEPHPEWGTAVVAGVSGDPDLDGEVLRDALRRRLAPHEVPKRIEVVPDVGGSWKERP